MSLLTGLEMAWLERYLWPETSQNGWYAFQADGFQVVANVNECVANVNECESLSIDTCISQGQVNAGSITTVKGSRQQ